MSNRAGLEEAFIVAAEKEDGTTEEMAVSMRAARESSSLVDVHADVTEGVQVSENLFLDDIDDEEYEDEDDEDFSDEDEADLEEDDDADELK